MCAWGEWCKGPFESQILLPLRLDRTQTLAIDAQNKGLYKSFLLYDPQRGRFQACSCRLGQQGAYHKNLLSEFDSKNTALERVSKRECVREKY